MIPWKDNFRWNEYKNHQSTMAKRYDLRSSINELQWINKVVSKLNNTKFTYVPTVEKETIKTNTTLSKEQFKYPNIFFLNDEWR